LWVCSWVVLVGLAMAMVGVVMVALVVVVVVVVVVLVVVLEVVVVVVVVGLPRVGPIDVEAAEAKCWLLAWSEIWKNWAWGCTWTKE